MPLGLRPLLPLLAAAILLFWTEASGRATPLADESAVSGGAAAFEIPEALLAVAPWPEPGATLVTTEPSALRVRAVGGAPLESGVFAAAHGSLDVGVDGLPRNLEFRVPLDGDGTTGPFWRDVLGVNRVGTLDFVGARTAVRRRAAVEGAVTMNFAGIVTIGPRSRRVDIEGRVVRTGRAGRLRLVGLGRVRPSDFGLPDRWGLAPWAGERTLDVVLDLIFEVSAG